jgi:hypothetical protein
MKTGSGQKADKSILFSTLRSFGTSFLVSLGATHLLCQDDSQPRLDGATLKIEGVKFNLTALSALLKKEQYKRSMIENFVKSCYRACLCESWDAIKKYCESTGQLETLQQQCWYNFARLVRNALSHDFTFVFFPSDMKKLPVTWAGRTIVPDMEGSPITFRFLDFEDVLRLHATFQSFVSSKLH